MQRSLRKATAGLPCTRAKTFSIDTLLSKITSKEALRRTKSQVAASGDADADGAEGGERAGNDDKPAAPKHDAVCCAQCMKPLDAADRPTVDVTLPRARGECAPLFCSKLCITFHRSARARAANAGGPGDGPEAPVAAGAEADNEDDEEEDELVVLPLAARADEAKSQSQLRKLISGEAGGGASTRRHGVHRRQLRQGASFLKVEEARTAGRYVEAELSNLVVPMAGESQEVDEEEEEGEEEGEEEEEGAEEAGVEEEATEGTAQVDDAIIGDAAPAPCDVESPAVGAEAETVEMPAVEPPPAAEVAPPAAEAAPPAAEAAPPRVMDELDKLLAEKQRREASEAQMRIAVAEEINAKMDVGLRVNKALAEALLPAAAPTGGVEEAPAAAADAAAEESPAEAETAEMVNGTSAMPRPVDEALDEFDLEIDMCHLTPPTAPAATSAPGADTIDLADNSDAAAYSPTSRSPTGCDAAATSLLSLFHSAAF